MPPRVHAFESPLSNEPQKTELSFWHRRIRTPLLALLTHGATPEKLASAIAWSFVCSLFPIFGTTTLLNASISIWRRLNLPLMQALNYGLTPLHVIMIVAYVRFGEWIWQVDDERFSVMEMISSFKELSFLDFLQNFGWAGAHACTAWALTAPLLFVIVYYPARLALRHLNHLLPAKKATPPLAESIS